MRTFKLAVVGSIASMPIFGSAEAGEVVFRSPDDADEAGDFGF